MFVTGPGIFPEDTARSLTKLIIVIENSDTCDPIVLMTAREEHSTLVSQSSCDVQKDTPLYVSAIDINMRYNPTRKSPKLINMIRLLFNNATEDLHFLRENTF